VRLADVTGAEACFGLWGPQARDLLAPLTPVSLANADFPFGTMQETTVGDVPVRLVRVTFVGELGWELYCPTEYGAALWRTLAGTGVRPCGYRAIESLRLEKGYRVWGADLTPETTPDEAGLAFAVRKEGGFVGRAALLAARERGPARALCCLVLDDARAVALGGEPVRIGGEVVGQVTSGGYGYTVARSIAYAYLPVGVEVGAELDVQVDGTWEGARVAQSPLYDPKGERIRA
jgi:4-methylaminobutanoate oxidase (formaldehyde-forming)